MKYSIELLKSDIRDELEKLYKLEKEFQGVQEKSLDKHQVPAYATGGPSDIFCIRIPMSLTGKRRSWWPPNYRIRTNCYTGKSLNSCKKESEIHTTGAGNRLSSDFPS